MNDQSALLILRRQGPSHDHVNGSLIPMIHHCKAAVSDGNTFVFFFTSDGHTFFFFTSIAASREGRHRAVDGGVLWRSDSAVWRLD